MAARRLPFITPEEYLAAERQAALKSEYVAGEVFAMAGATKAHSKITFNVTMVIGNRLAGHPCEGHSNDMKIRASTMFAYPDLSVVCGEPAYLDGEFDTLTNPTLIVEVLSPTSESFDRGEKWARYQTIVSLREYVLISQHTARIEVYTRQGDGSWAYLTYAGVESSARLHSIGSDLPLAEVYANVELVPQPGLARPTE